LLEDIEITVLVLKDERVIGDIVVPKEYCEEYKA
jgi:hypothetical protein